MPRMKWKGDHKMGPIRSGDGSANRGLDYCRSKRKQERPYHQPFAGGQPSGHLPARHWRRTHRPGSRAVLRTCLSLFLAIWETGARSSAPRWISSDDTFEVYRGRVRVSAGYSPVWRYIAKDSLNRAAGHRRSSNSARSSKNLKSRASTNPEPATPQRP